MNSPRKSAIALSIACLFASTRPVFAQLSSSAEPLDEVGTAHSKIVDIDIVTNSPTLQGQCQSVVQQPQAAPISPMQFSSPQSGISPQQSGMIQQSGYSAATQSASVAPTSSGNQTAAIQPIQFDSQTVGRVVGVAGTALILGAFLKNGGVGGMMNSFGLDNRFHSRGSSLAPY